jgi:two-component system, NtrC family, response regulator AtoC
VSVLQTEVKAMIYDLGISESKTMNKLRELALRIAKFPSTVLVEGETGSGKEIMANWIHYNSNRKDMPFIKVNCGAIPESLIESELFGYERGAFTGAKREGNAGIFEQANKGTLLLDEIGELPHSMQVKLLRVIQDREVRRVGGSWSKIIDVRIIASTNENLAKLVEDGRFRKDLYYRLRVAQIVIPPLRERRDDIKPLLNYFLNMCNVEFEMQKMFDQQVLDILNSYDYYGNVRELRNIVESAYITSTTEFITSSDLPNYIFGKKDQSSTMSLSDIVDSAEKKAIEAALSSESSIRKAAKLLGVSNATLLRKMKKFGL